MSSGRGITRLGGYHLDKSDDEKFILLVGQGEDITEVLVHMDTLMETGDYFTRVCKEKKEKGLRVIQMPHENPNTIYYLFDIMDTGKLIFSLNPVYGTKV